jgi:lysophospholipase L1-like esterase
LNLIKRIFRSSQEKTADRFRQYIALGDSISTDDYPGEGKGAASLLFKNQNHLFPEFKEQDFRSYFPGIDFLNLAQDGASTSDVLHIQLEQIPQNPQLRTVFTLTAGGNDILELEGSEEILFRLGTIVGHLLEELPQSIILLGTIYDPTDGSAILIPGGEPLLRELQILAEVNRGIFEMARDDRVRIADLYTHFLGHGTQSKNPLNPYYNPEDPTLWYVLNIEPNTRGAHEARSVFWNTLKSTFL